MKDATTCNQQLGLISIVESLYKTKPTTRYPALSTRSENSFPWHVPWSQSNTDNTVPRLRSLRGSRSRWRLSCWFPYEQNSQTGLLHDISAISTNTPLTSLIPGTRQMTRVLWVSFMLYEIQDSSLETRNEQFKKVSCPCCPPSETSWLISTFSRRSFASHLGASWTSMTDSMLLLGV